MARNEYSSETRLPSMRPGGGGGGPRGRFRPTEKPKDAKRTLLRIVKIYLRWGKSIFVAMLLTALASYISVRTPYYVGECFNTFDLTAFTVNYGELTGLLIRLGVLYAASWLISTVNGLIMLIVSQKLVYVLRSDFFAKLQRLPLSFFDVRPHGDTMSRLTNDVDNISSTIAQTTTQLLSSILTLAGSVAMMISLNIPLFLTVLVALPLVGVVTRLIAGRSRKYFSAQSRSLGAINGVIEENILGLKMVKAFGRQPEALKEFGRINEQLYDCSRRAQVWSGFLMPLMNVINNLTFALVAIVGGILSVRNGLLVGTVVSFLSYSKQFGHPLNAIAGMFNTIQSALAGAERVFEVLDMTEEPADLPDAVTLENPKGAVEFRDVCFSYTPARRVLDHVSFRVEPGQTVALVGETGAGKTTVVNLLSRFYDADSGSILIDGQEITSIRRENLRRCFSVVLQETCLFSGTILDNIRYSVPTADDERVMAAARLARADEFIRQLPEGYQTRVSGSVDCLSQGQRQLLAIARAVLSESPILILDEATSSVDTKTEKDIQRALLGLMRGRTSFLIAHRLSTIRDADTIMVIGEGRILESGNHEQLMARKGRYYEMVVSQMGLEEPQ